MRGVALDTAYNEERKECIKLMIDSSELLVVLDNIKKMEAETENPHFKLVSFA